VLAFLTAPYRAFMKTMGINGIEIVPTKYKQFSKRTLNLKIRLMYEISHKPILHEINWKSGISHL